MLPITFFTDIHLDVNKSRPSEQVDSGLMRAKCKNIKLRRDEELSKGHILPIDTYKTLR